MGDLNVSMDLMVGLSEESLQKHIFQINLWVGYVCSRATEYLNAFV